MSDTALGLLIQFADLTLQVYDAIGQRLYARETLRKLLGDYEVCCRIDGPLIDEAMN